MMRGFVFIQLYLLAELQYDHKGRHQSIYREAGGEVLLQLSVGCWMAGPIQADAGAWSL